MKNYRKVRITLGLTIAAGFMLSAFQNCSQTKFTKGAEELSSIANGGPSSLPAVDKTYSFSVSSQTNNKMDILFVIDNSGSMQAEQLKLAQVFQNFIQSLSGLDYRVAITTTDNSAINAVALTATMASAPPLAISNGAQGGIIPLKLKTEAASSSQPHFLDSATPNANAIFIDSIQTGISGSGTETGMTSIKNFISRSIVVGSREHQFIRPNAMFSTIVVTDSDQAQTASQAMSVSTLLNQITSSYGVNKKYVHHSSIALPGDSACLAQSEVYGTSYYNLSVATGGINASLCSPDYAAQFQLIAEVLINKVSEQTLECAPIDADGDGSLDISIRSSSGVEVTGFTVVDKVVKFASALSNVDSYSVQYKCAQ